MWNLHQTHRSAFWSRCAVTMSGRVDLENLASAIYRVVEEHEILRTTFTVLPGMTVPVQVIHPESPGCVKRHDLKRLSEEEISQLYGAQVDLPVDAVPLFRCDLLELSRDETVMLLSVPAICADLRSLEIIVDEIASFYAGANAMAGAMQYADFAEWHHELLESEEGELGRRYWGTQSPPAEVSMSFEKRANDNTPFQPRLVPVSLSPNVLKSLAAEGSERSSVVLACWQILIRRLAGTAEIAIGIACDGRRHPELVNSVGPYSRYVLLQIEANDQLTILELSDRFAQAEKEVAEWQDYFAWPNTEGYFSVCFEERRNDTASKPAAFWIYQRDAVEDRFNLKLVSLPTDCDPRVELHYDAARFDSDDIRRMADGLATLITNAIRTPAAPVGELESLSDEERTRIVEGFNQTTEAFPEACIHTLFERQARQTPGAVAVVCGLDKLTYAQLNQRANQLARYLQKLGIGADVPVGLCLERSLDFVVCMLGILKAGAAYLPLDVNTPHERLSAMLADTRTPILIARHVRDRTVEGCRTFSLDAIAAELAAEETHDCTSDVIAANLAYVIFTSGS
ncbi:MAG TPA: condensation domain-containing protein, partial [Pyrinomonadaceae bacterium]|nr:condensation domain-containing protein [Pyrinomonadaceae bacterium]